MSKIEDKYKEYAVKIVSNGIEGSGCIFQPADLDHSYVLTAKHCIIQGNTTNLNIDSISVKRYAGLTPENNLMIQNVFLDPQLDIAILKVERIKDINQNFLKTPDKSSAISIYGYPIKLKNENEPRENISCKVSFRHHDYFELTSDFIQFTYESSVPENIIGMSGSGVFFEEEHEIHLCGIFTRLKGIDGIYNKFCAFNINAYENLAKENNLKPLISNDTSSINRNPDLLSKVFYLPYKVDSEPYYLNRVIDSNFESYFLSPKNIWVSGTSGIGKTNLVFRNLLFNKRNFVFIDLSTLQNQTIQQYFEYINEEIISQCDVQNISSRENILEQISENLEQSNLSEQLILLFIDEVPISDQAKFDQFAANFITISEIFLNKSNNKKKIKWIISTRINPKENLKGGKDCFPNAEKANKNFNFNNMVKWEKDELLELLRILEKALNFTLNAHTQIELVSTANGFPGKVKDIVERVILEKCTIEQAIEIVRTEIF